AQLLPLGVGRCARHQECGCGEADQQQRPAGPGPGAAHDSLTRITPTHCWSRWISHQYTWSPGAWKVTAKDSPSRNRPESNSAAPSGRAASPPTISWRLVTVCTSVLVLQNRTSVPGATSIRAGSK